MSDDFLKEQQRVSYEAFCGALTKLEVPAHLVEGLARYFVYHVETGKFLRSVLENDLLGAYRRADPESGPAIPVILEALLAEAPAPCWGSVENVKTWLGERAAMVEGGAA